MIFCNGREIFPRMFVNVHARRCPNGARAVPVRCTHGARCKNTYDCVRGVLWRNVLVVSSRVSFLGHVTRANICIFTTGTVRAPYGHCTGTVRATQTATRCHMT